METVATGRGAWHACSMSALEVLEHLREANPKELAMIRDTAESLLSVAQLTSSEDREIVDALGGNGKWRRRSTDWLPA
jgi:hypothetical protein